MSLVSYKTHIFLNYKSVWFVWESEWNMFRPVSSVSWTGDSFWVDDRAYCADPTSEHYGYGSENMKLLCTELSKRYNPSVQTPTPMKTPAIGQLEWMYDRLVSVLPCSPRSLQSWKKMIQGRHSTLRHGPRNKLTRRVL